MLLALTVLFSIAAAICLFLFYSVYQRFVSLSAKLDNYVKAFGDQGLFSGAILIAKNNKILLCKAYGMADIENDVPNMVETKFKLGSITKQFTAMAIVQLQQMGKLNVQDPLSKYIPDYPNGNKITIHYLLTHTSGIPSLTDFPEYHQEKMKQHTLEQLIERFIDKPLDFNPGEKYAYSNSNYILLTFIIEKTSGQKYVEFLKEHILEPLAMNDTGVDDFRKIIKHRASGYSSVNGELANAAYIDMSVPIGSGGMFSTVKDLYLWDQALYSDQLVPYDALNKMFTPFKDDYGYGFFIKNESRHGKLICHGGGIDGFRSEISRYVDHNICIIILSNFEFVPMDALNKNLADIVFGQEPQYTPKKHLAIAVNPQIFEQFIGTYKAPKINRTFVVTKEKDNLFIEVAEKNDKHQVFPESETDFFLKGLDIQFAFVKDSEGKVIKLILHQAGRDDVAEKVE